MTSILFFYQIATTFSFDFQNNFYTIFVVLYYLTMYLEENKELAKQVDISLANIWGYL